VEHPVIDSQNRDWYSVSVDTLRAWGMLLAVAVLAVVGYFGYRYWESHDLERRASATIGEARQLMNRLQGEAVLEKYRSEYQSAIDSLSKASAAFGRAEYAVALERGSRARTLLESIFDAVGGRRRGSAAAHFITVQGRVEYRRGDGGDWQEARARVNLQPGDHVRTAGDGSAEIMFLGGTLYTARPDTQLIISRSRAAGGSPAEQAIRMDYGWVNLNTSSGGKVATPEAEARVGGDSEATVTYDASSRTGRFATYRGSMEVSSKAGERRRVEALEQVVQRGDRLADTESLPRAPLLAGPEHNAVFDLERTEEVVLSWQPAEGATGYALQVTRNHLFVDNVIDVENRETTRATLGVRGEGSFRWRVASMGEQGVQGPWSAPHTFRVTDLGGEGEVGDGKPPELKLEEINTYGSFFIVAGSTEPGTMIEINGEPVQVEADGSFKKTIQITQEGWSFIEVRARDAAGNETVENPRVFVEIL
jgi:hypothetical protein